MDTLVVEFEREALVAMIAAWNAARVAAPGRPGSHVELSFDEYRPGKATLIATEVSRD